jgi:hypothetical protein
MEAPITTSGLPSLNTSLQMPTASKLRITEPTSWQTGSSSVPSSGASDEVDRAESSLVNTVITSASFSQLTLTEVKKADRHGCIYEAKQITDETLFEVRVYSFHRKNSNEKQYVKRNCREWKNRRRFIVSHQENGFLFLILRHPQTTVSLPPSTPGDQSLLNCAMADAFSSQAESVPSLEVSPHHPSQGFTSENLSQLSVSHKNNLWSWDSKWNWLYPVGWSRKLMINDEGVSRKGLFLLDFDGGFFNETVPRRIFSPEHLSHPDERELNSYVGTENSREKTRNYNPGK